MNSDVAKVVVEAMPAPRLERARLMLIFRHVTWISCPFTSAVSPSRSKVKYNSLELHIFWVFSWSLDLTHDNYI